MCIIEPLPTDADGEWHYMGEYRGTVMDYCGSKSGGDDWWRFEDENGNVEYSQEPPRRMEGDDEADAMDELNGQLFEAIDNGDPAEVREAIDAGADVDAEGEDERRPLHFASHNADLTCLLLNAGASVDVRDSNGASPLHSAAYYGDRAVLTALLKAGARTKGEKSGGNTVAHEAAQVKDLDRALDNLRCLAEHEANLKARNDQGLRPADVAEACGNLVVAGWIRKH